MFKKILDWIKPKEGERSSLSDVILLGILMMLEGEILWKLGEYIESISNIGKQITIFYIVYILIVVIWGALFLKIRLKAIGKQLDICHEIAYDIVILLEYCIAFTLAFLCMKKSLIVSLLLIVFWFIMRKLVSNNIEVLAETINKLCVWFKGLQSDK